MPSKLSFLANFEPDTNNQALNIIFLEIPYVLYYRDYDLAHTRRMQSGTIEQIKSYSAIREKISNDNLANFNAYDLSALLGFDERSLTNLRKLCDKYHAKIVISNSWGVAKSLGELKAFYAVHNLDRYIIDSIDCVDSQHVQQWLEQHNDEINSYVILDGRDHGLTRCFGLRHVKPDRLFNEDGLYENAASSLAKRMDRRHSLGRLLLEAIENNCPTLSHVEINDNVLSELKLSYGCDTNTITARIFNALKQNRFITHLTLHHFSQDVPLQALLADFLLHTPMKLEYLNISENKLDNFSSLTAVLDGHARHIPHIVLSANPVGTNAQKGLAQWIMHYPKPLQIDLNLKAMPIDGWLVEAVEHNKYVRLYVMKDSFGAITKAINHNVLVNLIESGRIIFCTDQNDLRQVSRLGF